MSCLAEDGPHPPAPSISRAKSLDKPDTIVKVDRSQNLDVFSLSPSAKWCDMAIKVSLQGSIVCLLVGLKRVQKPVPETIVSGGISDR